MTVTGEITISLQRFFFPFGFFLMKRISGLQRIMDETRSGHHHISALKQASYSDAQRGIVLTRYTEGTFPLCSTTKDTTERCISAKL